MLSGASAERAHLRQPLFTFAAIRRLDEPDQALSNRSDTTEAQGVLLRMWMKVPAIDKCRHLHRRNNPPGLSGQCFPLQKVRRESQTFIGLGIGEDEGRPKSLFEKPFQQSRHCTIPHRIEQHDMIGSSECVLHLSNRFGSGFTLEILPTSTVCGLISRGRSAASAGESTAARSGNRGRSRDPHSTCAARRPSSARRAWCGHR